MNFRQWITDFRFNVRLIFCKLFGKEYYARICGHNTKLVERVNVCGEESILILDEKKLKYCAGCFSKMTIQCAWCGNHIMLEDPVTLYTPGRDFVIPKHAVVYQKSPIQLVGCLGWGCATSGADVMGRWVLPGMVKREICSFEILSGITIILYDPLDTLPRYQVINPPNIGGQS